MAVISLFLFILAFAGLFLPGWAHEIIGALLCIAVLLHNLSSRGFYSDLFAGRITGRRRQDAAVIVAVGVCFAPLVISVAALLVNYRLGILFLPSVPWMTLHIAGAVLSVACVLVHMKQEWS